MDLKDFEAFKQNFELFSKIDTPEKLEICKSQYERYLLNLASAEYFEPEIGAKLTGISLKYHNMLNQLLETDKIRDDEFYLLVMPSFEPESLIILSKNNDVYSLLIRELDSNYWDGIYSNEPAAPQSIVHEILLPPTIGPGVFGILSRSMDEARKLPGGNHVIDGVKYFLSRKVNGIIQTVSKHSPDENSFTGKVLSMTTLLAAYAKTEDINCLDKIMNQLEDLKSR